MLMTETTAGDLLRQWRQRRRMSQLDLAGEAEISQRHLSFLESGRAKPSREMVLRLAQQLDIPLRERNHLLLAAGFAPRYGERRLDDPSLDAAREAIRHVLKGHEPNPAIAIDRHWHMVDANAAIAPLLADIADPGLLKPPVNVLRLSLHPAGLAPRVVNRHEWRLHLLDRLKRQLDASGDPFLADLERELASYPAGPRTQPAHTEVSAGIVHPLILRSGNEVLTFISTTTIFGTPLDVTLSELAIESFFPADQQTATALRKAVGARQGAT
ncbi:helix-turn-helix domain-containing protein [Mesorhizobium sp. ZMM04-5]|uniref:Helix-turn-helix domain-containing protein n=1 Tax=Mesorhizobium marinum TaxID=3228790 RepID=A0ABV3R0C9_9HYPH